MTQPEQDYYDLLGISPNASGSEIKEAFRRLAQKYHPDRGSISADHVDLFKRITEAYRTLNNPDLRNEYNKEHGHLFHEEITIGGVGGANAARNPATDAQPVEIVGVNRDFNQLHKMAGGKNDLKVDQKVAQVDEQEMTRYREEGSDVAAWGDLEASPVSGGILSNLLGGRRKGTVNQRRAELKKNIKRTMSEESIPKKPSHVFEKATVDSFRAGVEAEAKKIADPLRDERVYRFQITALEAAIGCAREVVISTGDNERISKTVVDIPAGTTSGTVLEIARGWDRAKAEVSVVQDPRFQVSELDISVRIPISLKEALDGARISVPGLKTSHQVTLRAGQQALSAVVIEEAGIHSSGRRGNLQVLPFIVPPQQHSGTLVAAAASVDAHYDGEDVRAGFSVDPEAAGQVLEDVGRITFFVPIYFGEAIRGTQVTTVLKGVTVKLTIPPRWNPSKEIVTTDYTTLLGGLVYVQPQIALPKRSSAELQAAALAIEQHFLSSPRSHLPKRLSNN